MILIGRTDISISELSIVGHILKDFMEIFQDGAFPNLEYHLFHVNLCVLTLNRQRYCDK